MSLRVKHIKGKITKMVVVDFESRPQKAVSFVIEETKRHNGKNDRCPKCCLASAEANCTERRRKRIRKSKDANEEGSCSRSHCQYRHQTKIHRTVEQRVKQNWACLQKKTEMKTKL